jgi:peptidoglycan hydrolase-like protein with peptidoglycan-binding domain
VTTDYNIIAEVQSALAERGYYHGVIDGIIGPRRRQAIEAYQVDQGLPVTGQIDGKLLAALRLI